MAMAALTEEAFKGGAGATGNLVPEAFAHHEVVRRAQLLLLRMARREEAAMMMQAAWRLHAFGPSSSRLSERRSGLWGLERVARQQ